MEARRTAAVAPRRTRLAGEGRVAGSAPPRAARARPDAPEPRHAMAGPRKSAAGETGSLFGIVILVHLLYIRGSSGHYTHTRVEGTGAVAARTRSDAHAHTTTQSAAPDLGGSPSPRNGRHTYGHNMQGGGRRSLTERTAQPHSGHACEVTNRSHYAANALAARRRPHGHNETRGFQTYASPPSATLLFPIFLSYSMPMALMEDVNAKKPKMPHAIVITDCVCASFFSCAV